MADDIKIKGMNSQAGDQNQAQQNGQNVAGQTAGAQQSQNAGDQSLNPVIDLRNIDQASAQQAGAQNAGGQTAGQTGLGDQLAQTQVAGAQQSQTSGTTENAGATQIAAQQPATSQSANPRRANAIVLGDEEPMQTPPQEKYAIPALVKEKFPDLVQLIKETESMNDEERDYWFQILPIMTEEQIKKFRDILVNEKEQLKSLDQEYEQELNKLNEKHMIEWKEFESKEKRKSISTAEQASKQQEKSEEEELLKRLSQV